MSFLVVAVCVYVLSFLVVVFLDRLLSSFFTPLGASSITSETVNRQCTPYLLITRGLHHDILILWLYFPSGRRVYCNVAQSVPAPIATS